MQCPDCGYVMTDFDKDCPRCAAIRARKKSCLHCGNAIFFAGTHCGKCGQEQSAVHQKTLHQETSPSEAQAQAVAPIEALPESPSMPRASAFRLAPALDQSAPCQPSSSPGGLNPPFVSPPLSDHLLACRMCGNTAAQKVTAICRAGSWTTHSQGYTVGMGDDGHGHTMMVGGSTASTSHGHTGLVGMLLPPPRPAFHPRWTFSKLVPSVGIVLGFLAFTASPMAATCIVGITSLLWLLSLVSESRAESQGRADFTIAHTQWEHSMQVWNRLFYCSRCDHVYDPQQGGVVAPGAMRSLLHVQSPTPLLDEPRRLSNECAVVIVGLSALAALMLIWGVSLSRDQSEKQWAQAIATARAPLAAKLSQALSGTDASLAAGSRIYQANASVSGSDLSATSLQRTEAQEHLGIDIEQLKSDRETAKESLDDFGRWDDASTLQSATGSVSDKIQNMNNSCQRVDKDIADLSGSAASPGISASSDAPAYQITTKSGGAPPPDLNTFKHN